MVDKSTVHSGSTYNLSEVYIPCWMGQSCHMVKYIIGGLGVTQWYVKIYCDSQSIVQRDCFMKGQSALIFVCTLLMTWLNLKRL